MRRTAALLLLLLDMITSRARAQALDWTAINDEALHTLADYIKVNTTDPPGNELDAARFLKKILDKEGIEATIYDTTAIGANRANLYARLKGNGSKKAVALVSHMDVVPVAPAFWSVDPFAGVVKDGYIWGRGSLDMKGQAIVQLMAMIAIKRSGVPLNRDIVFIGNADEEFGGEGAVQFVKSHADLLKDVEFLMTEGGENLVVDGKLKYYGVGVSEKQTFWQKVVVTGVPSHGSRPTKQNPVPRLVVALARIARYETPLHVLPDVQKFLHDIAPQYKGEQRAWLADVRSAVKIPRARKWLTDNIYWNAILRNTISLTMLQGSNKTNVIPAEASAQMDIRLLSDTDPAEFLATLKRIANDTAVHWVNQIEPKTKLQSPIDTDLFRAIEKASHERNPNVIVTTPMFTAASDRPTYRALGIITYGFDPFLVENEEMHSGMHGNNERLAVSNVGFGVKYLYDVLRYVQ
ncbi:MAG: M20/M25/M40 family metallo-hydrolase [Gemmatimonadaceae bacterium]|nr:M20/M25/M40 family metallo-hydrolase [Gemmatimonadaceae bacterium]